MIPSMTRLYFAGALSPPTNLLTEEGSTEGAKPVVLSPIQATLLVGLGLQKKSIDELEVELGLPAAQLLALFVKICRKCSSFFKWVEGKSLEAEMLDEEAAAKARMAIKVASKQGTPANVKKRAVEEEEQWDPTRTTLEDDLDDAADETMKVFRAKQREMIDSMNLTQYAITSMPTPEDLKFDPSKPGSKVVSLENKGKKQKTPKAGESAAEMAAKLRGETTGLVGTQVALDKAKKSKFAKQVMK
jgi:N-acetyltransferase 10